MTEISVVGTNPDFSGFVARMANRYGTIDALVVAPIGSARGVWESLCEAGLAAPDGTAIVAGWSVHKDGQRRFSIADHDRPDAPAWTWCEVING